MWIRNTGTYCTFSTGESNINWNTGLVDMLNGGPRLIQGQINCQVNAGGQAVDKTATVPCRRLPLRERHVQVGKEAVQVQGGALTGGGGAEYAQYGHAADFVAAFAGEWVQPGQRVSQVVVHHYEADRQEGVAKLTLTHLKRR